MELIFILILATHRKKNKTITRNYCSSMWQHVIFNILFPNDLQDDRLNYNRWYVDAINNAKNIYFYLGWIWKSLKRRFEVNDIQCMHMNFTEKIRCKVAASTFSLRKMNYTVYFSSSFFTLSLSTLWISMDACDVMRPAYIL